MRHVKQLIVAVPALVAAVALVACGGSDDSTGTTGEESTTVHGRAFERSLK